MFSKRNFGIGISTGVVVGFVGGIAGVGTLAIVMASVLITLGLLLAVGE